MNEVRLKKSIQEFIKDQDYFSDRIEFGEEPEFGQVTRTQLTPTLEFYFLSIYVNESRVVENPVFGVAETEYDLILILINEAHISREDNEQYEIDDDNHKILGDRIVDSLYSQDNFDFTEDELTYRWKHISPKSFNKGNEITPTDWDDNNLYAQVRSEITFTLKEC